MMVRIIAPPEKMFLTTNGPSYVGVHFPPGITLRQYDAFDHQIPDLIFLTSDFLVKSLGHSLLIRLTMTDDGKSLLVD